MIRVASKKVDYKKRPIPMGYIIAKDILPVGCCMGVRTAKGDIFAPVGEDTVVIIGEDGSVRHFKSGQAEQKLQDIQGLAVYCETDRLCPEVQE